MEAESWRQKRIDMEHWLEGVRSPSPETIQQFYGGFTSDPDIHQLTTQWESKDSQQVKYPPVQNNTSLNQPSILELHTNQDTLHNTCEIELSPSSSTLRAGQYPVNEPLATLSHSENVYCTQTSLSNDDNITHTSRVENLPGITTEPRVEEEPRKSDLNTVSPGLELLLQKSVSPLPMPTLDNKLPTFSIIHAEPNTDMVEQIQRQFRPKYPLKTFTRALTMPENDKPSIAMDTHRRGSSPVTYSRTRFKVVPDQALFEYPDQSLKKLSRRKSLSHDDISQHFMEEATLSRVQLPMHCLSSEHLPTFGQSTKSNFSCESSTGACGLGSDLSWEDSVDEGSGVGLLKPKDMTSEESKGILSSLSKDALKSRLRERKELLPKNWPADRSMFHNDSSNELGYMHRSDEPAPYTTSFSSSTITSTVNSPSTTLVQSPFSTSTRPSYSLRPTSPSLPYQTSVTPLEIHSDTRHILSALEYRSDHLRSGHLRMQSDGGISQRRLRQFNMSQQFSFDTTNEEDLHRSSKQPKFLRNITHHQSQGSFCCSDTSLPLNRQELVQVSSSSPSLGQNSHCITPHDGKPGHLSGQVDILLNALPGHLNSIAEKSARQSSGGGILENKNKMKLFEQIQLQKSQLSHKEYNQGSSTGGSGSSKTQIMRQDSGLGTLSTVSNLF